MAETMLFTNIFIYNHNFLVAEKLYRAFWIACIDEIKTKKTFCTFNGPNTRQIGGFFGSPGRNKRFSGSFPNFVKQKSD